MIEAALDRLLALRNGDGGWGATVSRPSCTEATALSLMALSAAGLQEWSGETVRWLTGHQRPDGSWPVMESVPQASWTTSIAVLSLHGRLDAEHVVQRGLAWLTASKGTGFSWRVRLAEFLRRTKTVDMDLTLEGWSWTPGAFSWVEPTSWAILALRAGYGDRLPRAARQRIDEGLRLIVDRACPGGGWNYGNSVVLGVDLEPYPDSTALALLALAGAGEHETEADRGFGALQSMLRTNHSGLTLSLSILCHRAWGRDDGALRSLLEESFERTGFMDDVRSLALAVIATGEGPNPVLPGHG